MVDYLLVCFLVRWCWFCLTIAGLFIVVVRGLLIDAVLFILCVVGYMIVIRVLGLWLIAGGVGCLWLVC